MANSYESAYTGTHNDNYEVRIAALEQQVINLQNALTAQSVTFTAALSNYLPLTGGTLTGRLTISNGADLYLKAASDSTDSGDLVYANGAGVEQGRLWSTGDSGNLSFRPSSTASSTIINQSYQTIGTKSQTVSFTTKITTGTSSWVTWLSSWTAPSNGWLVCYMSANGGSTPSAACVDNTTGFRLQQNGNGSRDYALSMPVAKGHNYSGSSVYTATNSLTFYPAINC